ncbi:hypothetical protein EJ06DRAFT_30232 [Trichodelitschia bisporula]|uniref:Uncharacterized protein n=1 Tax=Trichodelitschia bisporula TaxID=703511 RepID=A0A6G1IBZ6_9PEZI|nr:hypothetical protein EJ06DRAFT_30232 [Trichodelitschia bisporula]
MAAPPPPPAPLGYGNTVPQDPYQRHDPYQRPPTTTYGEQRLSSAGETPRFCCPRVVSRADGRAHSGPYSYAPPPPPQPPQSQWNVPQGPPVHAQTGYQQAPPPPARPPYQAQDNASGYNYGGQSQYQQQPPPPPPRVGGNAYSQYQDSAPQYPQPPLPSLPSAYQEQVSQNVAGWPQPTPYSQQPQSHKHEPNAQPGYAQPQHEPPRQYNRPQSQSPYAPATSNASSNDPYQRPYSQNQGNVPAHPPASSFSPAHNRPPYGPPQSGYGSSAASGNLPTSGSYQTQNWSHGHSASQGSTYAPTSEPPPAYQAGTAPVAPKSIHPYQTQPSQGTPHQSTSGYNPPPVPQQLYSQYDEAHTTQAGLNQPPYSGQSESVPIPPASAASQAQTQPLDAQNNAWPGHYGAPASSHAASVVRPSSQGQTSSYQRVQSPVQSLNDVPISPLITRQSVVSLDQLRYDGPSRSSSRVSRDSVPTPAESITAAPPPVPDKPSVRRTNATNASALGFGGPSDWEYFGPSTDEIDDTAMYSHKTSDEAPAPLAAAELPSDSLDNRSPFDTGNTNVQEDSWPAPQAPAPLNIRRPQSMAFPQNAVVPPSASPPAPIVSEVSQPPVVGGIIAPSSSSPAPSKPSGYPNRTHDQGRITLPPNTPTSFVMDDGFGAYPVALPQTHAVVSAAHQSAERTIYPDDRRQGPMQEPPMVQGYPPHTTPRADPESAAALASSQTELSTLRSKLANVESELAQKESSLAHKDSLLAQKESSLVHKDSLLSQKDSLLAQKDSVIAQKGSVTNQLETSLNELQEKSDLREAEAAQVARQTQSELETLRKKLSDAESAMKTLKTEKESAEAMFSEKELALASSVAQVADLNRQLGDSKKDLEDARQRLDDLKIQLEDAQSELEDEKNKPAPPVDIAPGLDPWFRGSLERFRDILYTESNANTVQEKLKVFMDFVNAESSLRGVDLPFGSEGEVQGFKQQKVSPLGTPKPAPIQTDLKARAASPPSDFIMVDSEPQYSPGGRPILVPRQSVTSLPSTPGSDANQFSVVSVEPKAAPPPDPKPAFKPYRRDTLPDGASAPSVTSPPTVDVKYMPFVYTPAASTSGKASSPSTTPVTQPVYTPIYAPPPVAPSSAPPAKGKSFSKHETFLGELETPIIKPEAPLPPPLKPKTPAPQVQDPPTAPQIFKEPGVKTTRKTPIELLQSLLPSQSADSTPSKDLRLIRTSLTKYPSDFGFISVLTKSWETGAAQKRDRLEVERRARQDAAEQRTNELYEDQEIGYGDIETLENQAKAEELDRKAAEDREEYASYNRDVFDPVFRTLQEQIGGVMNLYADAEALVRTGVAGFRALAPLPGDTDLADAVGVALQVHKSLEERYEEVTKAVVERDRRYKRTETKPFYARGDIASMKKMEKAFELNEKRAEIKAKVERAERCKRLWKIVDASMERGVGENEEFMAQVRDAAAQAAARGVDPEVAKLITEACAVLADVSADSTKLMKHFEVVEMNLNECEYEVSVASAKLKGDGPEYFDRLERERGIEDEKLIEESVKRVQALEGDLREAQTELDVLLGTKRTSDDPEEAARKERLMAALDAAKRRNGDN